MHQQGFAAIGNGPPGLECAKAVCVMVRDGGCIENQDTSLAACAVERRGSTLRVEA